MPKFLVSKSFSPSACSKTISSQISEKKSGQNSSLGHLSFLSRQQQRKVKLFILKASRPILKRAKVKTAEESDAPGNLKELQKPLEVQLVKNEFADSETALSALQAYEEARRLQRTVEKSSSAIDSALHAVDWMLDLAHTVPYEWPMFGWMKEEKATRIGSKVPVILEEEVQYPRCAWPRKGLYLPTPDVITSPSIESEQEDLSMSFPRCSWPRKQVDPANVDVSSDKVVKFAYCDWPRRTKQTHSLSNNDLQTLGPRCPWPRKLEQSNRNIDEQERDKQVIFLEKIFAADQDISYPRCEWPRKNKLSEMTEGPRCPWPRRKLNQEDV